MLHLLSCDLQAASASRSKDADTSVLPREFSLDSVASSLTATGSDIQELASGAIEDTKAAVQSAAEQAAFKAQLIQRREARARCALLPMSLSHTHNLQACATPLSALSCSPSSLTARLTAGVLNIQGTDDVQNGSHYGIHRDYSHGNLCRSLPLHLAHAERRRLPCCGSSSHSSADLWWRGETCPSALPPALSDCLLT